MQVRAGVPKDCQMNNIFVENSNYMNGFISISNQRKQGTIQTTSHRHYLQAAVGRIPSDSFGLCGAV